MEFEVDVWTVLSQKGGAGKTTIATNLAVTAQRARLSTVVIDMDRQRNSVDWGDDREGKPPLVFAGQEETLPKMIEAAQEAGADLVIVDTPPHSEANALAAIRAADIIILPLRPSIHDVRAVGDSVDLLKLAVKTDCAMAVLNAVRSRDESNIEDATEAVKTYGIRVSPVKIGNRKVFETSAIDGLAAIEMDLKSDAATEVKKLYQNINKVLKEIRGSATEKALDIKS